MKIVNIEGENLLNLLNDSINFKEIFRKDVAYNDIKCHKKAGFYSLTIKHILEKPLGRSN